jgi:hypothetical protein
MLLMQGERTQQRWGRDYKKGWLGGLLARTILGSSDSSI